MTAKNTTLIFPTFLFIGLSIFFFLFAAATQFFGYLNPDNAWLIHVAEQVIDGKILHKEIIETNPPLIVYIMLIPAYFAQVTGLPEQYAFTSFIFLLSGFSIWRVFQVTDNAWLRLATIFCLTFFAGQNFGQREHLFVLLALPYILGHLYGKAGYTSTIMAAIGFAIKPYYILLWAFVELYSAFQKRDIKAVFNLHNYIISGLIFVYLAYLFFIEQDYIREVLPQMLAYYGGFNWSFEAVFRNVINNFILFQIPIWVALVKYKKAVTKEVAFFAICNFICITIVLYQQKSWTNHFYPVSFFGIMANVLLVQELLKDVKPRWNKLLIIVSTFILTTVVAAAIGVSIIKITKFRQESSTKMIELLQEHAAQEYVYPLSFDLPELFPEILYTDAKYGSRYGHLWMLPGIYSDTKKDANGEVIYNKPSARSYDEVRVVADILADIAHNPPMLIFVSDREYNSQNLGDFKFDFIKYMSSNPDFVKIFSNYEKLTKIDDLIVYKYKESNG